MVIDVKPSKILLNESGEIKFYDFGKAQCKPYMAVSGNSGEFP